MLNNEMPAGTKDDKNYCCTSAAGQAMPLQMHLLAVVLFFIIFSLQFNYTNFVMKKIVYLISPIVLP